ncbi:hypothetical protein Ppa06_58260 [Planomonospora parontospora subsp. parontospora]|uniref:Major tail protein n=2 Tax=Planomonospora parontospora TaxID=58119 RepID=A0AA37F7L2_9ACTN|nr:hypothetical protein [Planomonospora parontospora]GGK90216.1 hypothetical protein GCM10010126_57050 [Planomonospora parontospora]GII12028.1 hypothetical protein Ppa06_58260 [Planomonospora parontospora subsp. parontospora]
MALRSLLAKDWTVEVNTGTQAVPVWTPIKGLTKFAETIESETQDDSDFDSNGWGSDVVTQRKFKLECEGRRKRDTGSPTFVPDPGQEAVRQAGRVVGVEANIEVRWYRKDGSPDAYQGFAAVDYKGGGGETTDLEPFAFDLLGQGEPTEIENPAAA